MSITKYNAIKATMRRYRVRSFMSVLYILIALFGIAFLGTSLTPTYATGAREKAYKALEWRTLYIPRADEVYTAQSDPVLPLLHAKPDEERAFRVCATASGDGEILLNYGDGSSGEGVEFHTSGEVDVCAQAYVGEGGHDLLRHKLSLYVFQRGERLAQIRAPEIKVGVATVGSKEDEP